MSSTTDRILREAWRLCRERPVHEVTVADVARASGVSRQALYLHFGDRAGLLTAAVRHHDETSGFVKRVYESFDMPPREGLERLLRAWCAYMHDIEPVARALAAGALLGDESGLTWEDRMRDLRRAIKTHMRRLEQQGALAPGWTADRATDWAYARTHLASWRALVRERRWSQREATDRLVGSLLAELIV